MSLPINGNQGFNKVQYSAAVGIQDLNVSNLKAAALTTGPDYNLNGYTNVVGYAPTSFATAATGTFVSLSKFPNQATVTADNALKVPNGAIIFRQILTNNGTTLASGVAGTIGLVASSSLNATGTALASANTQANINTGTTVASVNAGAISGNNYINAALNQTNTSGSLGAVVSYFIGPGLG